jgi:hypothetical protein
VQVGARRSEPFLVGESRGQPALGCPAPRRGKPLPGAKNLPGFGSGGTMTVYEVEDEGMTSETIVQKIFDELPVP